MQNLTKKKRHLITKYMRKYFLQPLYTIISDLCSERRRPSEWTLLFLRPNPVDGTWPRTNFHVRSVLLSEVLLPGLKCTAIVRVHVNEDKSLH